MTDPDLTEAREIAVLAARATPGPWSVVDRHHAQNQMVEGHSSYEIGPETIPNRFTATVWKPRGFGDARPTAAFIAAAPKMASLIARLAERVERLEGKSP